MSRPDFPVLLGQRRHSADVLLFVSQAMQMCDKVMCVRIVHAPLSGRFPGVVGTLVVREDTKIVCRR